MSALDDFDPDEERLKDFVRNDSDHENSKTVRRGGKIFTTSTTTPQHKDTTLDDVLKLPHIQEFYEWCGEEDIDEDVMYKIAGWLGSEVYFMPEYAKPILLQWRDKAVVEARADELNALIRKLDTDGEFTFILSDDIEDRLKQLKETPNED